MGSLPEDSDVEIGNQKKKLVGDDSERHQFQLPIEADEEKHEHHNVSTKYGIIQENDFAESQAETDRNDVVEE